MLPPTLRSRGKNCRSWLRTDEEGASTQSGDHKGDTAGGVSSSLSERLPAQRGVHVILQKHHPRTVGERARRYTSAHQ